MIDASTEETAVHQSRPLWPLKPQGSSLRAAASHTSDLENAVLETQAKHRPSSPAWTSVVWMGDGGMGDEGGGHYSFGG